MCFRSGCLCSSSCNSPQYSTSQPLPRQRHPNRRRGNSLTLYHAAVTNSQLRRKWNRIRCCSDKTSASPVTDVTNNPVTQTLGLQAENADNSLDILLGGKLCAKNIKEMLASATPESSDRQGLRAKSIDGSLDILLDSGNVAVTSPTSDDSGRSSCQSNVLSTVPITDCQSPSTSPAYLMTSTQSAATVSSSSSFNDLQLHCFSSDGLFSCYSYLAVSVC